MGSQSVSNSSSRRTKHQSTNPSRLLMVSSSSELQLKFGNTTRITTVELAELAEEIRNVVQEIAPTGVASKNEVYIGAAAQTRSAGQIIATTGGARFDE